MHLLHMQAQNHYNRWRLISQAQYQFIPSPSQQVRIYMCVHIFMHIKMINDSESALLSQYRKAIIID